MQHVTLTTRHTPCQLSNKQISRLDILPGHNNLNTGSEVTAFQNIEKHYVAFIANNSDAPSAMFSGSGYNRISHRC